MNGREEDSVMGKLTEGQELVLLGEPGTKGIEVLSTRSPEKLRTRFSDRYLSEETKRSGRLKEALRKRSAVELVSDYLPGFMEKYGVAKAVSVGRGGVLAALWQFLAEEGLDPKTARQVKPGPGCRFSLSAMPVSQFTIEVCELFQANPYRLLSENCWILALDRGFQFVRDLLSAEELIAHQIEEENYNAKGLRAGFEGDHHARTEILLPAAVFGEITGDHQRLRTDTPGSAFLTKEHIDELDRIC
jgi:hydrogenase maturation factor